MNQCQSYLRLIKRMGTSVPAPLLPVEYQQVEYLQSSGNQYIDTGIYNNVSLDYYCKINALSYNSNNYIFGTWYDYGRCFVSYASNGLRWLGYRDGTSSNGTMATNTVLEISGSLKPGTQTLYVDNVLITSMSVSRAPSPADTIYLYASHNYRDNSNPVSFYITARIYRFTLWGNSTKILDYVPCYRKSDNKPGMYDLIANTFKTNKKTGADFTVGSNV